MDPDKFAFRWLKEETLAHVSLFLYMGMSRTSTESDLRFAAASIHPMHTCHFTATLPLHVIFCLHITALPTRSGQLR